MLRFYTPFRRAEWDWSVAEVGGDAGRGWGDELGTQWPAAAMTAGAMQQRRQKAYFAWRRRLLVSSSSKKSVLLVSKV